MRWRAKTTLIAVTIVLDQLSKIWALHSVRGHLPRSYLGGIFRLEYAENPGAFLSLGSSLDAEVRFWIFTIAVAGFLAGTVVYLFKKAKELDASTSLYLCFIAAGGFGNLIDRVRNPNHAVIDFLNVGMGSLRTGIFNVADMAIMGGVIGMLIQAIWTTKSQKSPGTSEGSAERLPNS